MKTYKLVIFYCAAALLLADVLPGRAQEARPHTNVPREVLAFYYTWYGLAERHGHVVHWGKINTDKHDISDSTHYPVQGAYDSYDPALIDRQLDLAKAHGVTGFIATWWGQKTYDDQVVPILLYRAQKKNFKITVYWETAPSKDRDQIDHAVIDLVYLATGYGTNKAF